MVATPEIKWNEHNTRMLIDLYKKYKTKVGTIKVKTVKQMWQSIGEKLQQELGMIVTPNNCENRWKVLDRNYKKYVDNKISTGRGKKYFEYYEDMERIYGRKKSICPDILLTSQSIHVPQDTEHEKENLIGDTGTVESHSENDNDIDTATTSVPGTSTKLNENQKTKLKKRKSNLMENIRRDRQKYQEKRLQIEMEKLEQLKRRNQLMEERNKIIKEKCCKCSE